MGYQKSVLTERESHAMQNHSVKQSGSDNGGYGESSPSNPALCGDVREKVGLHGGRWKSYPLAERLAARTVVDPTTGCWNFQGCKVGANGYGQIAITGKLRSYAHRVAWALAYPDRPVSGDARVCHRCDNPRCVNPDHLFLGTQKENIHDCIRKGRRNAFGKQKLTESDVLAIRSRCAAGERHRDIAKDFGLARHSISAIKLRQTWAHLPEQSAYAFRHFGNVERVPTVQLVIRGEVA